MLDKAFAERILHDYKVGLKNVQGEGHAKWILFLLIRLNTFDHRVEVN